MRHFPLRELGYAIGIVVLLAALYVGAYYAMVSRGPYLVPLTPLDFKGGRLFAKAGMLFDEEPEYSVGGVWSTAFFAPIHAIDRRIRPTFWRHS
jgi:hypothetical protein